MTTDSWPPPEGVEPGKSGLSRRDFIKIAAASAAAAAAVSSGVAAPAFAGPPKPKMSTPTITCGVSSDASIDIRVCAGATGAPAGFSIQWMTLAEYQGTTVPGGGTKPPNTWYDSTVVCKASFSGVPGQSTYNLPPPLPPAESCVTVNIGNNLFDDVGASSNCAQALLCNTDYVFRAFAHANSTLMRSDFTPNLQCSTDSCGGAGCTFTFGYWATHGSGACHKGNNIDAWPVDELTLGNVTYSPDPVTGDPDDLCSILNESPGGQGGGNGLIQLAHQLIAAKLNVANGSDDTAVAASIAAADALIGDLVVPPVGDGYLAPANTSALVSALTAYNEGTTGPGHCPP